MHRDNEGGYHNHGNDTADDIQKLPNLKPQAGVELLIATILVEKQLCKAIQSIVEYEQTLCRHSAE
jgi:hypothetical protein